MAMVRAYLSPGMAKMYFGHQSTSLYVIVRCSVSVSVYIRRYLSQRSDNTMIIYYMNLYLPKNTRVIVTVTVGLYF